MSIASLRRSIGRERRATGHRKSLHIHTKALSSPPELVERTTAGFFQGNSKDIFAITWFSVQGAGFSCGTVRISAGRETPVFFQFGGRIKFIGLGLMPINGVCKVTCRNVEIVA